MMDFLSARQRAGIVELANYVEALTGKRPYLCGSALERIDFRDIDLRVAIGARRWHALFRGPGRNLAWVGLNIALGDLGTRLAGHPVDVMIGTVEDEQLYARRPRARI